MGEQNLSGGGIFQRDHQPPGAARHEHSRPSNAPPWAWISTSGHRTFALRAPQLLTWKLLYRFGAHPPKPATTTPFKRVLRELKKIKLAWKELNYSRLRVSLILHRDSGHAPSQSQLTSYPPFSPSAARQQRSSPGWTRYSRSNQMKPLKLMATLCDLREFSTHYEHNPPSFPHIRVTPSKTSQLNK